MALGYDSEQNVVNLNDTADLTAYLYDPEDNPLTDDDVLSVTFIIQKPDGSTVEEDGDVQADGGAFLRFAGTDQEGEYRALARFQLDDGAVRSTHVDFEVKNPFGASNPSYEQQIGMHVWARIEDLFDSEDGGPWMRDMTLRVFSPSRSEMFIPEALLAINVYNPPTHFDIAKFAQPTVAQNPDSFLLVQGTLVAVIRHLMRTYVEQPAMTGGDVTYEDRRDYLQRWGTILQIEFQLFDQLVKLWKRQFLGLNQSKQLVASKAGRLLPAPLRTRNIGRGYY
jgi:hypothetical protein